MIIFRGEGATFLCRDMEGAEEGCERDILPQSFKMFRVFRLRGACSKGMCRGREREREGKGGEGRVQEGRVTCVCGVLGRRWLSEGPG